MVRLSFEDKVNGILSATVVLFFIVTGINCIYNYCAYNDKITQQGEKTKITKMYGPFSRLEIVKEKGLIREISQISRLEKDIKLELDENEKVKTLTKIGFFQYGKAGTKATRIEEYASQERERINQSAQNYIKYFKDN